MDDSAHSVLRSRPTLPIKEKSAELELWEGSLFPKFWPLGAASFAKAPHLNVECPRLKESYA